MAASCSRMSRLDSAVIPHGGWKELSDSVFEVFRPSEGYFDLEIVFLHGFQSKSDTDSYYRTWMKADGSANLLDTSLAESFPRARILSVSYDSSLITSPCTGRVDLYLLGETLVQSLVDLAGVGRTCPVVLVGHCLGGMVLKKIALSAETLANQERSGPSFSRPYETFLRNVKGAFFLSTPSLGANVPITNVVNQGGPLLKNLELLGNESARINAEFAKLRRQWKWKTYGVFAANETETTKLLQYIHDTGGSSSGLDSAPQYLPVVPEASARSDMDGFGVISGVDHFTICQSSGSFAHLINFLTKIQTEEVKHCTEYNAITAMLRPSFQNLDHRLKSVIEKLELGKAESLGLALVGIDGIGKSTLGKQVINTTRHRFEYICLVELENVDRSRRSRMLGMLVAQNLLYSSGRRVRIDEGEQPWVHIRGKKVLMVVDDVYSEDEISQLFAMDWCGKGSRLIITSSRQDWRPPLIVHQVPLLSKEASHELLATHLDESTLKSMPKKVISEVVDECCGLPLVLEVIGKYLWDKREVRIWSGALQRLQMADSLDGSAEENVVWKKLRISFDSLGKLATFDLYPTCKTQYDSEIFRTTWGGEWKEERIDVALINLERRSFLRLVYSRNFASTLYAHKPGAPVEVVWIHKQMRAMAAWISGPAERELEHRRSIWELHNVTDLLTNCSKDSRPRTEVLSISVQRKSLVDSRPQLEMVRSLQLSSLDSLKVLRLLRISDTHMLGADKLKFPAKLALLHMEDCTREPQKGNWWLPWSLRNFSSWPLSDRNMEELGALSVLIFRNCSGLQLPQNFYMLRRLKILQIHNDGKPMTPLPENIGLLPALKHLSLNTPLKKLPNSLLQLHSLQSLVLSGEYLQAWPAPTTVDSYSHLTALTKLHLMNLPALAELPDTFGGLTSLEDLEIWGCSALEKLPEGFGALSKLRTLSIQGCSKLETLCESFGSLSQLLPLNLQSLPELKMLQETIGGLSSLEELEMRYCDSIKDLPESFATLQSVLQVVIQECGLELLWPDSKYLDVNQGLRNLYTLYLYGCSKLQGLPRSLEQLKSLKRLSVEGSGKFRYGLESLLQLTSLETVRIDLTGSDDERESLESPMRTLSLCTLGSTDSQILPALTGFPGPVEELENHSSTRTAVAVDSVMHLPGLKWLVPQDFQYSNSLPQTLVHQSTSTSLPAEDCIQAAGAPGSVGQLSDRQEPLLWGFEELKPNHCSGVAPVLEMTTMWTGTERLHISDCQTFSTLPDTVRGKLSLLGYLELVECQDLVSLPESIGQLSSLTVLNIRNCKKLRCLPESVGHLKDLHTLHIEDCRSILTIPDSVYRMTWLSDLRIFDYRPFESKIVRVLREFTNLKALGLSTWNQLISFQESMGLNQLETFQLPMFRLWVKCMECEDTVVPSE
ncbi:hypothetical protein R1sor_009549 [Riccia sorocarpa]|uniref:NB-ARC domain-containing protein n=1 Tax=Riccia sorocarpa TaxID=122646 RepID=A0ABD3HVJ1_9MARC